MELYKLSNLFPIQCSIHKTRGTHEGIIVKFNTFYLKIYNNDNIEYRIQGFRYDYPVMIFEEIVNSNVLEDFCKQFNREDYLYSFIGRR